MSLVTREQFLPFTTSQKHLKNSSLHENGRGKKSSIYFSPDHFTKQHLKSKPLLSLVHSTSCNNNLSEKRPQICDNLIAIFDIGLLSSCFQHFLRALFFLACHGFFLSAFEVRLCWNRMTHQRHILTKKKSVASPTQYNF